MVRRSVVMGVCRVALIVAGVILLSMPAAFARGSLWRPPPIIIPTIPFPGTLDLQKLPDIRLKSVLPDLSPIPRVPAGPELQPQQQRTERSADSYYQEGVGLFDQGRYEEAIDAFRAAGNLDHPNAAGARAVTHHKFAVTAYQAGSIDQAIRAARGWRELRPKPAVDFLLQIGEELTAKQQYYQALAAYEAVGDDSRAYEGVAWIEYHLERFVRAFAALDQLSRFDRRRAALTKGDMLLNVGAIPLAVEEYQAYASDSDVERILSELRRSGLDRFERRLDSKGKWLMFDPFEAGGFERTARYLFRVEGGGYVRPTPFAVLSQRPAPRSWSLRLAWSVARKMEWPATEEAVEYKLTIRGSNFSDIVAIWEDPPSETEIVAAASRGERAVGDMREGERLLHEGRFTDALYRFRQAADLYQADGSDWHYGALVNAVMTAATSGGDDLERLRGPLEDRYPYWGRMAWAGTLTERGRVDEARGVLKELAEDWPLRHEALEQLADLEWGLVLSLNAGAAIEASARVQQALVRVRDRRPGWAPALLRLAEVHIKLGSYALAVEALDGIDRGDENGEAAAMRRVLGKLNQDSFDYLGRIENSGRGIWFEIFQSRKGPPSRDTLIHHAVEIAVRDRQGNHVETFAVSSQALQDRTPRAFFLDRINHDGLHLLFRYEGKTPTPFALAQDLAAQ